MRLMVLPLFSKVFTFLPLVNLDSRYFTNYTKDVFFFLGSRRNSREYDYNRGF